MPNDERPITKADYRRATVTFWALELKAVEREEAPLWEILRDLHEEHLHDDPPVALDDLIGDEAVNREVHHARLLLESLVRGLGTMPARPVRATNKVCATPGCPNYTHASLCLHCELQESEPDGP